MELEQQNSLLNYSVSIDKGNYSQPFYFNEPNLVISLGYRSTSTSTVDILMIFDATQYNSTSKIRFHGKAVSAQSTPQIEHFVTTFPSWAFQGYDIFPINVDVDITF